MRSYPDDPLEQSKRLLQKRESGQTDFESRLAESKKALARSERLLAQLKEMIGSATRPAPGEASASRLKAKGSPR
jgi:hypothetical protein